MTRVSASSSQRSGDDLKRRQQKPLQQPRYRFCHVPLCQQDLADSILYEVTDRQRWKQITPELLLLCNEALERHLRGTKEGTKHGSKPLNLNYIADRIDLDDPAWGFCVRHRETGWLQGFVTATTFASWHEWMHWDSLAVDADLMPPPKSSHASSGEIWMATKKKRTSMAVSAAGIDLSAYSPTERQWIASRRVDRDGTLSRELEAELRVPFPSKQQTQPQEEVHVWPHVAEVSLLGGLGAGRLLLEKLLERLERPDSHFRYVVAHATHSAIPFYEKLGFVRVGAIVRHRRRRRPDHDPHAVRLREQAAAALVATYTVPATTPLIDIAVELHSRLYTSNDGVNGGSPATLQDVLFDLRLLNPTQPFASSSRGGPAAVAHGGGGGTTTTTAAESAQTLVVEKGTVLRVPARRLPGEVVGGTYAWELYDHHVAANDDTPMMAYRQIMRRGRHPYLQFKDFLAANARHIRGLKAKSRMKEGTRLCIPRTMGLDFRTLDEVVGYRHWTYPDEPYWDSPTSCVSRESNPRTCLGTTRLRTSFGVVIVFVWSWLWWNWWCCWRMGCVRHRLNDSLRLLPRVCTCALLDT